jgi:hypothetical protein
MITAVLYDDRQFLQLGRSHSFGREDPQKISARFTTAFGQNLSPMPDNAC